MQLDTNRVQINIIGNDAGAVALAESIKEICEDAEIEFFEPHISLNGISVTMDRNDFDMLLRKMK